MSEIEREIASQPLCWREAVRVAGALGPALPDPGARAAIVGCGTSLFVAQAFAARREELSHGETDAFAASEAPEGRPYEAVVAISRSGTTTEVLDYLSRLAARGGDPGSTAARTVAIVGVADSPVAAAVDAAVPIPFADERSVVQTRFATSALALLRAHLGEDLGPAIRQAEAAVDEELPVDPTRFARFVFLGRGWSAGLANEAALKLREAAGAWSESYPAMEFRHGPISAADERTLVWAIGPVEGSVLRDAAATGATVVDDGRDPVVELVMAQRAAVVLAAARGLDPDRPRHLTRSVVLSP